MSNISALGMMTVGRSEKSGFPVDKLEQVLVKDAGNIIGRNLSKRAKDSIGRAKDMAAQMSDAMNKVTKVVGPDFEKRLAQLEQLTACLERLSALNDAGKLSPMLSALSVKKD